MSVVVRGETKEFVLELPGIDLTGQDVFVTLRQGSTALKIDEPQTAADETGSTVVIHLTQENTLAFQPGNVAVEVKAKDENGNVRATWPFGSFMVTQTLRNEVV